ncbi:MAG: hypothetical protein DBX40_00720 [Clostridiales bacterium]|nr:MAG: hypothetical protein DBX40_00720 [Clostridiales bacterium]
MPDFSTARQTEAKKQNLVICAPQSVDMPRCGDGADLCDRYCLFFDISLTNQILYDIILLQTNKKAGPEGLALRSGK